MMRVVCAIIHDSSGKLLLTKRSGRMDHAFHWEFPGGKVKPGESDEQAIVREIHEELQIIVAPQKKLTPIEWQYPGKKIVLVPIICEIRSGTVGLTEHIAHCWQNIGDIEHMTVLGADRQVLKHLKSTYEN